MAQEAQKTGLTTKNMDIELLCNEICAYRKEIKRAASSSVYNVNTHDRGRLKTYLDRLQKDLDHFAALDKLDLPKWQPTTLPLPDIPDNDISGLDNPHAKYVITMLDAMYYELVNSQSSELGSSLEAPDKTRCEAVIQKLYSWLTTLEDTQPMDLPEGANANNPN